MVTINSAFEGRVVGSAGFASAEAGWKARKISTAGSCFSGLRSTLSLGSVKVKITSSPCCAATRSAMATGMGDLRSAGSPGAPQPVRNENTKIENRACATVYSHQSASPAVLNCSTLVCILQNVAAQILIFDDIRELFLHVGRVDLEGFLFHFGRFEGNLFEHFFQNGV